MDAGWAVRFVHARPYKMVKDHRTGHEVGNTQAVLDGRLDDFMEAYLRQQVGHDSDSTGGVEMSEYSASSGRNTYMSTSNTIMRGRLLLVAGIAFISTVALYLVVYFIYQPLAAGVTIAWALQFLSFCIM